MGDSVAHAWASWRKWDSDHGGNASIPGTTTIGCRLGFAHCAGRSCVLVRRGSLRLR